MIRQYPHYLYSDATTVESTPDADGNWTAQTPVPTLLSMCREETNGKGLEIQGADGKAHKYSSIIYLPKDTARIQEGTIIYVRDSETETTDRIKGPVLKFDAGQLHCRLWV